YLVYARRELVAVFACEFLYIHDYTAFTVGNSERSISYLSGLFTEYRSQEPFLCSKLRFSLRSYLSDEYIAGLDLCADTDYSVFVKGVQCVLRNVWNISRYLLWSELCISCLTFIFLHMDRGEYVVLYKLLAYENGVLVVIAFPCHKAYEDVLSKGK